MKRMRLMGESPDEFPQDTTYLCGMKTIMGDQSGSFIVTYAPDIVYARKNDANLRLQMLIPGSWEAGCARTEKYPLVVFVQGSAFRQQNLYMAIPCLSEVARHGYVVASVEYTPSDIEGFPAYLKDVKTAIRFLRSHADEYLIDVDRIAIWGDSSGANAALLAGVTVDSDEFKTDDYREYSDSVDLIIDFYGGTDMAQLIKEKRNPAYENNEAEDLVLGGDVSRHPELAVPANPLTYMSKDKKIPPVIIFHGDCDTIVPFSQSVLLYNKLKECNSFVEFYKVVGAEHGANVWTKEVMEKVCEFLGAFF